MSMLEQNTTKKRQIDKKISELDISNKDDKEYKVGAIWDNAIYVEELGSGVLSSIYYLIA